MAVLAVGASSLSIQADTGDEELEVRRSTNQAKQPGIWQAKHIFQTSYIAVQMHEGKTRSEQSKPIRAI